MADNTDTTTAEPVVAPATVSDQPAPPPAAPDQKNAFGDLPDSTATYEVPKNAFADLPDAKYEVPKNAFADVPDANYKVPKNPFADVPDAPLKDRPSTAERLMNLESANYNPMGLFSTDENQNLYKPDTTIVGKALSYAERLKATGQNVEKVLFRLPSELFASVMKDVPVIDRAITQELMKREGYDEKALNSVAPAEANGGYQVGVWLDNAAKNVAPVNKGFENSLLYTKAPGLVAQLPLVEALGPLAPLLFTSDAFRGGVEQAQAKGLDAHDQFTHGAFYASTMAGTFALMGPASELSNFIALGPEAKLIADGLASPTLKQKAASLVANSTAQAGLFGAQQVAENAFSGQPLTENLGTQLTMGGAMGVLGAHLFEGTRPFGMTAKEQASYTLSSRLYARNVAETSGFKEGTPEYDNAYKIAVTHMLDTQMKAAAAGRENQIASGGTTEDTSKAIAENIIASTPPQPPGIPIVKNETQPQETAATETTTPTVETAGQPASPEVSPAVEPVPPTETPIEQTANGNKLGAQVDSGSGVTVVTHEDNSKPETPDDYKIKTISKVYKGDKNEVDTQTRDMTLEEAQAKERNLKQANDLRKEIGLPEKPVPEIPEHIKPSGEVSAPEQKLAAMAKAPEVVVAQEALKSSEVGEDKSVNMADNVTVEHQTLKLEKTVDVLTKIRDRLKKAKNENTVPEPQPKDEGAGGPNPQSQTGGGAESPNPSTETTSPSPTEAPVTGGPATPPPLPRAGETQRGAESPTSTQNSVTEVERQRLGLNPAAQVARQEFGKVWADTAAKVAADKTAPQRLVDRLAVTPEAIGAEDNALLLWHQIEVQNELTSAIKAQDEAVTTLDKEDANKRVKDALDELQKVYDVDKAVGTATARGLNARKMLANRDFTLAKILAETRAYKKGGEPLSREEVTKIKKDFEDFEKTKKDVADAQEKKDKEEFNTYFNQLLKGMSGETKKAKAAGKSVLQSLEIAGDNAMARLRKNGFLKTTNISVNPADLIDISIYMAGKIAKGIRTIGEFTKELIDTFGKKTEPYAGEIFDKSQEFHDAHEKMFAEKSPEKVNPAEVSKDVNSKEFASSAHDLFAELAKEQPGLSPEEAVTTVHKMLEPTHPGLTERELRNAFVDYGKVKYPSQDADKVAMSLWRRAGQLISAIEDATKGLPPEKSGLQRNKAVQKIRDLEKQLSAIMRENGIETTSPDQQRASANQAKATALRNQIEDLNREFQTGEQTPKAKPTEDSPEVVALKKERDHLKEKIAAKEAIANPPKTKFRIENEKRAKALETRIADLQKEITRREAPAEKGKPILDSAQVTELKAARDRLQTQLDAVNKLTGKTAEEVNSQRETDLKKSIEDLDKQIQTEEKPAKPETVPDTTKVEQLRAERDSMRRALKEIEDAKKPKKSAYDLKDEATLKALDKQIADKQAELTTGVKPEGEPKLQGAETPEVAEKRAKRDELQKQLDEIEKQKNPPLTPDEKYLKNAKKQVAKSTAAIEARIAAKDYVPRQKPNRPVDKELSDARFANQKAAEKLNRGVLEAKLKAESLPKKVFRSVGKTINLSKALLINFNISAFRHGTVSALSHPIKTTGNIIESIKAFASEKTAYRIDDEIRNRPNAKSGRYDRDELFLADVHAGAKLAKLEEEFMSSWVKKIPILAGSERAYVTFLNLLRADTYDALADTLSKRSGQPSPEEGKAIAHYANLATGRGGLILPTFERASSALSTVFFSPRYVTSRFQLLLGQPLYGGTARTRAVIAGEYARFLIGAGVAYSLAQAAGAKVGTDKNSSDFGKLIFKGPHGESHLDFMGGLSQATVFMAREGQLILSDFKHGKSVLDHGKIVVVKGKSAPFGAQTASDVAGRFIRSKLSPVFGAAIDLGNGENMIGQPVTLLPKIDKTSLSKTYENLQKSEVGNVTIPITFRDMYETMKTQGVPKGTALSLLDFLSAGIQNHEKTGAEKSVPHGP